MGNKGGLGRMFELKEERNWHEGLGDEVEMRVQGIEMEIKTLRNDILSWYKRRCVPLGDREVQRI